MDFPNLAKMAAPNFEEFTKREASCVFVSWNLSEKVPANFFWAGGGFLYNSWKGVKSGQSFEVGEKRGRARWGDWRQRWTGSSGGYRGKQRWVRRG